ncbi:MAG TPA: FGGY-family carbohydrate kinase [Bryobacteraceae bacterium]|jgi:sugar (pentulose or hexulose) kinase|nr:FGGY-family carbohydrate kinase [Bryobacteraceae bacterium]
MVLSTRSSTSVAYIVVLEVGASSVRTLLFDSEARQVEGFGARMPRPANASPAQLTGWATDCLDDLHRQVSGGLSMGGEMPIAAVASSTSSELAVAPAPEMAGELRTTWPAFESARWLTPLSHGAAICMGSGCLTRDQFSLTIGTTDGVRALVVEELEPPLPLGVECSSVDAKRMLVEASLGGSAEVVDWMRRTLNLPRGLEARLDQAMPGAHGLTLLPFFENRGAVSGLSLATEPFDLLLAALESIALRCREACNTLGGLLGPAREVIASGAALLNSPASTQMLADALGRPVTICTEPEPAARGAAIWALEAAGVIASASVLPASCGAVFQPRPYQQSAYEALAVRQRALQKDLA